MATASVQYSFAPGTLIVSDEANVNFNQLVEFLNLHAMHRDASSAFANIPSGPAGQNPTSNDHLVRKAYVDMPVLLSTRSGNIGNNGVTRVTQSGWSVFTSKGISQSSSGRLTVVKAGIYAVHASAVFGTLSTFANGIFITTTGNSVIAGQATDFGGITGSGSPHAVSIVRSLSAGEQLDIRFINAAGTRTLSARAQVYGIPGTIS